MKDGTILKLVSMVLGVLIIETCLILGVDGAGMLLGGALAGLPVGAGLEAYMARRGLVKQS